MVPSMILPALQTPIPGLEGATDTDRYALSVQEVTPSPRTGIVFSSVSAIALRQGHVTPNHRRTLGTHPEP